MRLELLVAQLAATSCATETWQPEATTQGGCPTHAHCRAPADCPDALRTRYAYHWDSAAIVDEAAVCACDAGYAAVSGCRNASRCGSHLGGVHAEVRASGSCAPVLLHRLDVLLPPHEQATGCLPDFLAQCREDGEQGAVLEIFDTDVMPTCTASPSATISEIMARWLAWRVREDAGLPEVPIDPTDPFAEARAADAASAAGSQPSEAQRLCFDVRKALDSQICCACEHCKGEPTVAEDIDLLGDGSCIYAARDCSPVDSTLTIGLGSLMLLTAVVGCCGLYCLKKAGKEKKKHVKKLAADRWKGAGQALGGTGGNAGAGRLGLILAMAKAAKLAEEQAAAGSPTGSPTESAGDASPTRRGRSPSPVAEGGSPPRGFAAIAASAAGGGGAGGPAAAPKNPKPASAVSGGGGGGWGSLMGGLKAAPAPEPEPEPEPELELEYIEGELGPPTGSGSSLMQRLMSQQKAAAAATEGDVETGEAQPQKRKTKKWAAVGAAAVAPKAVVVEDDEEMAALRRRIAQLESIKRAAAP